MRNHITAAVRSFIIASALVAPLALSAAPQEKPSSTPTAVADARTVTGKITAKSDTSLSIGDTKISLTTTTNFTKGGAAIKLEDINVGDQVRVTTSAGDPLQAVAVEVVTEGKG